MHVIVLTHSFGGNGAALCLMGLLRHWVHDLGWQVDALGKIAQSDAQSDARGDAHALARCGVSFVEHAVIANYDFAMVNTALTVDDYLQLPRQLPVVLWVHEGKALVRNKSFTAAQWCGLFETVALTVFPNVWQRDRVYASFLLDVPAGRVACIPNGLLPRPSQPYNSCDDSKGHGLGAGGGGIDGRSARVVFCGTLSPLKRPQDLVAALDTLPQLAMHAVFVGTTAHLAMIDCERFVRAHAAGSIHRHRLDFLGEMSHGDAQLTMAQCGIFVSCSADETQGMAALEAASMGLVPVLTDLPAYRGIWQHDHNALLYQVGDTAQLSAHLCTLQHSAALRERLAQEAKRTSQRFDWNDFENRFDTAVLDALAMDPPAGVRWRDAQAGGAPVASLT